MPHRRQTVTINAFLTDWRAVCCHGATGHVVSPSVSIEPRKTDLIEHKLELIAVYPDLKFFMLVVLTRRVFYH